VRDGETTVIGGIYTRSTASRRSEVPFLGKLPLLGYFFRNTSEQDDHTELLIFITPRIINRQATAVASGTN
jgi:type IV pilus assembly protein PilQ